MEPSYESAVARVCQAGGPLAAHLGPFVAWLIDQQYTASVVQVKARHAVAFDRWLGKRCVVLADLGEIHIEQYQRFLRARGVCEAARLESTPTSEIAASFGQYLQNQQGLASTTIERYATVVQQFLTDRFGREVVDLRALRAVDAIQFVQGQGKHLQPPALKCVANALRSFLRYAQYRGEVASGLAAAVPSVATWATTPPLPQAISPEHAQRAIDSCDTGTAIGRRDRAVLLLLARLGLRAHEILALTLEDCDWDSGYLRVRGKGGHEGLLPMPADVGEAIAAYLEHGRPISTDRHLFLRSVAPVRGLMEHSGAIGSIVRYALRRARVNAPHSGSHQFRHALAVRMLQGGASLSEIGDVLRHRSPQTTSIYARVDLGALRPLALPWPGEAR